MSRLKKNVVKAENSEPNEAILPTRKVEARHVITYVEPITVAAAETEPVENEDAELMELEEDDSGQTERAAKPSFRTKLRERLAKHGISDVEQLRLRVDRLPHYDENGLAGVNAEKDFVRIIPCVLDFITNDDYLEFIRSKDGPGAYWFTLRYKNTIAGSWHKKIGGMAQTAPIENPVTEVYQSAPTVDPMTALLKQAKQFGELRKLLIPEAESQPQQTVSNGPQTTEQALLTLMNVDSGLVDTVAGKLRGLLRSSNGNAESEKSWLDVLYAAIERDTLPKLINQFATQFRPGQPVPTGQSQQQPTASAEPPQSADAVAYQRLISVIVNCARVNGDVTPALQAIDGFVALFPEHAGAVDGFLNAPVEMSLPALAQSSPMAAEVVAMPHAAEWFGRLKTAFFDSGEIEETKQ